MAKILRPRRGTASVAKSQLKDNKLASGEVFFELPDGGSWGKNEGRIIMGDGNTAYENLKAFIDPTNYVHKGQTEEQSIQFTETSSTDNAALLKTIVSGVSIKNAFAGIKNLLSNLNSSVTQLNNDLDKSKTDIEYHWGEIEKKVPLRTSATYNGTELELPPIVVLRQLTEARDPDTGIPYNEAYTIGPKSSKWYSIISQNPNIRSTKDNQTFFSYIMENLDKKYSRAGSVGAMGGQGSWVNSSDLPMVNKVCIVNFNGSGVRITNMLSTNQTIPLKYSTSATSKYGNWDDTAYPPYVDLIYIRRDLVSTCY